jgi:hypothetical protein
VARYKQTNGLAHCPADPSRSSARCRVGERGDPLDNPGEFHDDAAKVNRPEFIIALRIVPENAGDENGVHPAPRPAGEIAPTALFSWHR